MSSDIKSTSLCSPNKWDLSLGDKMVFGGPERSVKEIERILRLTQLDIALGGDPSSRKDKIEKLAKIWAEAQQLGTSSPEAAKQTLLNRLAKLDPSISAIYAGHFESLNALDQKIAKFTKDSQKLPFSPVKISTRGNKGPTFLVNYPTVRGMRAYVAKCSHLNELISNRVYDVFATCFSNEKFSCGFTVPPSARFDFQQRVYESTSREITQISKDTSNKTTAHILELSKLINRNPNLNPDPTHFMCAKRILGENLIDFAYTKYKDLAEEQRYKFFEGLGRLAMLDLVMGNLDRIIQIYCEDEKEYKLDNALEVNLGNVMVSHSKNDFELHAIDNGIDEALINSDFAQSNYAKFLANLFTQPKHLDIIVKNIIYCFENAIESQTDEIDLNAVNKDKEKGSEINLSHIRNELACIKGDLNTFAPDAFLCGLEKMEGWLRKEAIPILWDKSKEGTALQEYLSNVYPAYLKALKQRFDAFQGKQS